MSGQVWERHACVVPPAVRFVPAKAGDPDWTRSLVKLNLDAGQVWVCPFCGSAWEYRVPTDPYFFGPWGWWQGPVGPARDEKGRTREEFQAERLAQVRGMHP